MAITRSYSNYISDPSFEIMTTNTTNTWNVPLGPISRGSSSFGFTFQYEPKKFEMTEEQKDKLAGQALKSDKDVDLTIVGVDGIL